ncbi:hypothetical protein HZH68_014988 [Vespula germanica]|uniref:Uncharacterized protein n=1 Tax=Vespula germanica TaxID=30212 RepID=A0A834J7C3_VESGE|nr:hypothetical protein HZH68_014988 [Vespula germanica]
MPSMKINSPTPAANIQPQTIAEPPSYFMHHNSGVPIFTPSKVFLVISINKSLTFCLDPHSRLLSEVWNSTALAGLSESKADTRIATGPIAPELAFVLTPVLASVDVLFL